MCYTMKRKNDYIFIKVIIYLLFDIIFFIVLKQIFNIINAYYYFVYYIMIILYLLLGLFIYLKKYNFCIIIYYITLFIFLFLRKTEPGINLQFYLFAWLKSMFKNKVIFLNILGNIILFIPMGIINKNILKSFIIILIIELSQILLKKGIFDIVDIVLNMLGALVGFIGAKIWMKIIKNKRKIKK